MCKNALPSVTYLLFSILCGSYPPLRRRRDIKSDWINGESSYNSLSLSTRPAIVQRTERSIHISHYVMGVFIIIYLEPTRMWANAQRDGRPAKHRWRPLFNAAKFGWRPLSMPCSNAAKMRNPLKFAGVPQTTGSISAASGLKFTILCGHACGGHIAA